MNKTLKQIPQWLDTTIFMIFVYLFSIVFIGTITFLTYYFSGIYPK